MSKVTIYGASDDLIEVEGDISEEYGYRDSEDNYLAFSDGTLLSVKYDGTWNINLKVQGRATFNKKPHKGMDSEDYSDVVTLEADEPIKWAAVVTSVSYHKFLSQVA